jgi:DNA-binding HxlR family transcriptional regulator
VTNITETEGDHLERTYETQEGCPVAATLDVIGDRWTLLIIRDLTLGRSGKFKNLMASLQGISPNLLAQRLKLLEREGIVERHFYSDHPPRAEYRFTKKGAELGSVVRAMAEWGIEYRLTGRQRAAAVARLREAELTHH